MREETIKVYQFSELSDAAKEKARGWYREASAGDMFFAESITDDFKETLKACGFTLAQRHGRDAIQWSGFSSQGDGACFGASWLATDVNVAALRADRPAKYVRDGVEHTCDGNAELHKILDAAEALAAAEPLAYGSTNCGRGNYQSNTEYNWENDAGRNDHAECAEQFSELCNDLAHWFYRALERDYEYQYADAQVDESITCNEYEFTADGARY